MSRHMLILVFFYTSYPAFFASPSIRVLTDSLAPPALQYCLDTFPHVYCLSVSYLPKRMQVILWTRSTL